MYLQGQNNFKAYHNHCIRDITHWLYGHKIYLFITIKSTSSIYLHILVYRVFVLNLYFIKVSSTYLAVKY